MGDPERGDKAKRAAKLLSRRFPVFFPCVQNPQPSQEVGRSPRRKLVLPERECRFPGRAAVPSGKFLTHRPQGPKSVSGLCASVPGTVRVWSAVADTPQSTQTVSRGVAAGTHKRPQPRAAFFLPAG